MLNYTVNQKQPPEVFCNKRCFTVNFAKFLRTNASVTIISNTRSIFPEFSGTLQNL